MAGFGVQVEGLKELVRALENAGVDVKDLKEVFQPIARAGAEVTKRLAPVRSGALRKSVRGNRAKNKAVIMAGNKRKVPYAAVINYGWPSRGISANHFLQRTDPIIAPEAVKMLDRGIDELLRKAGLEL